MKPSEKYPHVFSPLKIGPATLKNRIQFSPMVCCLSSATGEVTPDYIEFLGMQARTGAALVTIGATSVDDDTGSDFRGELSITHDRDIAGLARIAEEVHRYGAKLSVEMCHAGRGAAPYLLRTPEAWAPTAIPTTHGTRFIREMDQRDIDHVVKQYADCAKRLKTAGFDLVMIHCAHGNLLAQFLSGFSNKRNDYYGGSFDNRMRFPLEVIQAVREAVGGDFALEMRISADEIIDGGMRQDETFEFLKIAQKYIDLVHVSAGMIVDATVSYYTLPPYYHPHMHNVKYAEAAKKVLDIPVTTVGSIKTLEQAEEIIAGGKADVVAMARQLMADPDTLKKSYRGQPETVRPCLRCMDGCGKNVVAGTQVRCSVNPVIGRENQYKTIPPAVERKKAVVVGGGVSGMMAAQTLARRGHDVTLYEAGPSLGGRLNEIGVLPFKQDLRDYTAWNIRTTEACGAAVRLNTPATREIIEKDDPDVLFIAAGADLAKPPIPGIDGANVVDVVAVDTGRAATGNRVVICGGGLSGLECALALAMEGRDVTVVDMIPVDEFGKDVVVFQENMLKMLLEKHGVKLVGSQKVRRITDKGVEAMDKTWNTHFHPADTVVVALGLKPRTDAVAELSGLVAETYVVGDCGRGRAIHDANHMAFNYAVEA